MPPKPPSTIDEYKRWLREEYDVKVDRITESYFDSIALKVHQDFTNSRFWTEAKSGISSLAQEYHTDTGYNLLAGEEEPALKMKPFESFLEKTFRSNVVNNKKWPEEPEGGWLFPDTWFSKINDLVRTTYVVKYLDGVKHLGAWLKKIGDGFDLESKLDFEAKDDGYYAAHFYIYFPCEVPQQDWDTKREIFSIEIQITTQIQDVIKNLLHKYYAERRAKAPTSGLKWQWRYGTDEFAANYLGHILHYMEGMIMDVRERPKGT